MTSIILWKVSLISFNLILLLRAFVLLLFAAAMFALPGCMVIFACENEVSILLTPIRAFKRGLLSGRHWYGVTAIKLREVGSIAAL